MIIMIKDMTSGNPAKAIILFAIPLLIGNIFQATYNIIDTIIVGQFVGPHALSGVGIASPVFNLFNALLIGLSVGSSIMISQLFGAKREKELDAAVSTILLTSLFFAAALTILGQLAVNPLLTVLHTPAEDFPAAALYLRVTVCGLICSVFYNQLAGLLRGLGNSRTPLYFLIFSCCINVTLDLVFVAVLHLGVAGAGLATVIAEGVSAVMTALYIKKSTPQLKLKIARHIDPDVLKSTIRFGLPMGFQQASISLGHILMQAIINPFGTALIAGYASACKIDMFAVMPIISLGAAVSTFTAQNIGAGNMARVKVGFRITNVMTVILCAVITLLVVVFRGELMSLFVSAKDYPALAGEIIAMGMSMLAITPLFYVVLGLIHSSLNMMAGAGDTRFSMYAMIFMMLMRVVLAWAFTSFTDMSYVGIWWAFPASWGITLIFVLIHYFGGSWRKKALTKAA